MRSECPSQTDKTIVAFFQERERDDFDDISKSHEQRAFERANAEKRDYLLYRYFRRIRFRRMKKDSSGSNGLTVSVFQLSGR
jgi:hypothetical protein